MKKIITLIALLFCLNTKAQYVTIPDVNFVTWLQANASSSMNGNQMDTTNAVIRSMTSIVVSNLSISDLTGIQYFASLGSLDCSGNLLTKLPALPNSLVYLICNTNQIDSLPPLPNSLQQLNCSYNLIKKLPNLPNTLTSIACYYNQLVDTLHVPNSVTSLNCEGNQITALTALPSSLTWLDCASNLLTSIPSLPNMLTEFYCSHNQLTVLPSLPSGLTHMYCGNNNISCFPILPTTLGYFIPDPNPYTCLPNYLPANGGIMPVPYPPLCGIGNIHGCPVADSCSPDFIYIVKKDSLTPYTWDFLPNYSSNTANARWYWDDGTSTMGLYPSHTYADTGWYNICVTVYSTCGDSSNYCQYDSIFRLSSNNVMVHVNIIGSSSDIQQTKNKTQYINIYPNPTNSILQVSVSNETLGQIKIVDVLGNEILQTQQKQIDVSNLQNGVYFICVGTSTQKFIVQH